MPEPSKPTILLGRRPAVLALIFGVVWVCLTSVAGPIESTAWAQSEADPASGPADATGSASTPESTSASNPSTPAAASPSESSVEGAAEDGAAGSDRPRPGWLAFAGVIAFVLVLGQLRVVRHESTDSISDPS